MNDLSEALFFDGRTAAFVQKLLSNPSSASPLTDFEKKLRDNVEAVRALNGELPNGIIKILNDSRSFVPSAAVLQMLLYAKQQDDLDTALRMMHFIVRDRVILTKKELNKALQNTNELPVELAIQFASSSNDERTEESFTERPRIDLPKDFS